MVRTVREGTHPVDAIGCPLAELQEGDQELDCVGDLLHPNTSQWRLAVLVSVVHGGPQLREERPPRVQDPSHIESVVEELAVQARSSSTEVERNTLLHTAVARLLGSQE